MSSNVLTTIVNQTETLVHTQSGGLLDLPAVLLISTEVVLVIGAEPLLEFEIFYSSDCVSGTDWKSILASTLPSSLASIASLLLGWLESAYAGFMVDESGVGGFPALVNAGFNKISVRVSNTTGTSPCSNPITVPCKCAVLGPTYGSAMYTRGSVCVYRERSLDRWILDAPRKREPAATYRED